MKKILIIFTVITLCFSCKREYQSRTIEKIDIKTFNLDSTSIRAIHTISRNKLLFAGSIGDIGSTDDGGKTWNIDYIKYQDSIVPHFRSIAKTKSDIFVLSIGSPALLYKVSDNDKKIVYMEDNPKVFYDSMAFFDENNGIAIGDPTENCTSIILTNDGGNTWKKIDCKNLPFVNKGEASFAASNTNIAIVGNTAWIVTGGTKARVFKSTDRGKTWAVFNTPIIQGNETQGIYSVDFADENNGIIIGGDYSKPDQNKANKAITKDGGKTWTLVADGQNPSYKSCVKYVPNTNGKEIFAVGKTGISFSNDKGKTWKNVSTDSFYSIQFVDNKTAWLSGHNRIGKLVLE